MQKLQNLEAEEHELEIIKAVAQAWHGHSNSSTKATASDSESEFDAHRMNFKSKPTRFKLEASLSRTTSRNNGDNFRINNPRRWDFNQSLWDSYEIVAVSNKLERGSVLDYSFDVDKPSRSKSKARKESENSLRKLFAKED